MREKRKDVKISDALLKVALGYQVAEVTEEYAEVDGGLKLTKRKKTKKDIPPDLKAVQLLLSTENEGNYSDWTEEKLQEERDRLLAELEEKQKMLGVEKDAEKNKDNEKISFESAGIEKAVKGRKVAGSVALNEKKARAKPRKRVARKGAEGKHLKE